MRKKGGGGINEISPVLLFFLFLSLLPISATWITGREKKEEEEEKKSFYQHLNMMKMERRGKKIHTLQGVLLQ